MQVVIAKIGHMPQLMAKVEEGGIVDRALERAPNLDQRIIESLEVRSDGRIWLMPEKERILRIVQKIGKRYEQPTLRSGGLPGLQLDAEAKFQGSSSRIRAWGWPVAILSSVLLSQT